VNPNSDCGASLEYMISNSSERLSSMDVDLFRISVSPKIVEALICGQNLLHSSKIRYEFRTEMEDAEKYNMPTNANLFI
jgi:hypothetical protein